MLAHSVFFVLKDGSDASKRALLSACRDHLTGHPGVVSFACGTLATELDRPVNDRDWDVALHLVFESQAAHDVYQESPRHHRFVAENSGRWSRSRVFDAIVEC